MNRPAFPSEPYFAMNPHVLSENLLFGCKNAQSHLLDFPLLVTLNLSERQGIITQTGGAGMAATAVMPRVRTIVVCDDVSVSLTEERVFTLEGVRQHLEAATFPWRAPLNLFLLLSSSRKGNYAGKILIVNERSDKTIRYVRFLATFQVDNELLPLYIDVGDCVFPEAGQYSFQIYFAAKGDGDVLKGEQPFIVFAPKE